MHCDFEDRIKENSTFLLSCEGKGSSPRPLGPGQGFSLQVHCWLASMSLTGRKLSRSETVAIEIRAYLKMFSHFSGL